MQDTQFKNELIDIIDEKIAESGGGLPEVTDADNGRVLGVDDGEWKVVENTVQVIWATVNVVNEVVELSYTFNELLSLTNAGVVVLLKNTFIQGEADTTYIWRLGALVSDSTDGDVYTVYFHTYQFDVNRIEFQASSATVPMILVE